MKILVVGMGLIGGSMCKALRHFTRHSVAGYDQDADVVAQALSTDSVEEVPLPAEFDRYDLILVCLHPRAARAFLEQTMCRFAKGAVVTDVCGIKGALVADMTALAKENGVCFVGMHPMAGKERFGFSFSDANLFLGANCILTPVPDTDPAALRTVASLVHELGFGRILETSPEEHDRIIAYTSQLAHVVSSAYVKSPTIEMESGFSGGSFQDMTRIATLNESMWASLFLENRECLLTELDTLLQSLTQYRDAIAAEDETVLIALLRDGRLRKEENLARRTRDLRQ